MSRISRSPFDLHWLLTCCRDLRFDLYKAQYVRAYDANGYHLSRQLRPIYHRATLAPHATRLARVLFQFVKQTCRIQNPDIPWAGRGRRRTAGWAGRAGPGGTGRRRVGAPRKQTTLLSLRASNNTVLNDYSEAQTSEFICKSTE